MPSYFRLNLSCSETFLCFFAYSLMNKNINRFDSENNKSSMKLAFECFIQGQCCHTGYYYLATECVDWKLHFVIMRWLHLFWYWMTFCLNELRVRSWLGKMNGVLVIHNLFFSVWSQPHKIYGWIIRINDIIEYDSEYVIRISEHKVAWLYSIL